MGVPDLSDSVWISRYSNEFGHNPGRFLSCTLLLHFLPHHVDPRLNTIINIVATHRIYDVGTEWLHAGFMMWERFFFLYSRSRSPSIYGSGYSLTFNIVFR